MPNKKKQMICPKCNNGQPGSFDIDNQNDLRDDLWTCKKCGHAGKKIIFEASQINPFTKEADGSFSDNRDKMPSNKGESGIYPFPKTRERTKKNRKKPESRLNSKLDPTEDENVRRVSMSNPFAKKVEKPEIKKSEVKESKANPFTKEAREFTYTEQQKDRKEDSKENMIFPEGRQDEKSKAKGGGEVKSDDEDTHGRYRKFDTIDRKEMRSSPNPKHIIPGHEEWENREVDHYYDGWVEDHIKNSGGSVPGSNTEKVMNLNDGERAHVPEFPTEAVYEALLEGRHELDGDLVKVIAEGNTYRIKKSDVDKILGKKAQFDPSLVRDDQPSGEIEEGPTEDDKINTILKAMKADVGGTALHQISANVNNALYLFYRENPDSLEGDYIDAQGFLNVGGEMECGGTMIASNNPFTKEARPMTKKEKETDSDESEDKMQTTEKRLESDEVNGGERIHKEQDKENQKKRKDVHAEGDDELEKESKKKK